MSKKYKLDLRKKLKFFGAGRFYWKLSILPFIGAFLAIITFILSLNGFPDDPILPISFNPLFFTVFLLLIFWIANQFQDKLLANNAINLYMLWPTNKRSKMLWLYFYSSWLPASLLFLGASIGILFVAPSFIWSILIFLPYAIASVITMSILFWKGSFTTVDTGNFPGKISYREETYLSFITFFISISPFIVNPLNFPLLLLVSLIMISIAVIYALSTKKELQTSGSHQGPVDSILQKSSAKKQNEEKVNIPLKKGPLLRYFLYLEWDFIQIYYIKPFSLKKFLFPFSISFISGLFIVFVYYALGGFLNPKTHLPIEEQAAYISLLITFTVFFSHWMEILINNQQKITLLLPVSLQAKSIARFFSKLMRPLIYTILYMFLFPIILIMTHLLLSNFMEQHIPPYWELVKFALIYSAVFIPFCLAILNTVEFLFCSIIILLQKLSFYKLALWLSSSTFFVSIFPFVFVMTMINQDLSGIKYLVSYQAITLYFVLFSLSKLGLHWTTKKTQVITS